MIYDLRFAIAFGEFTICDLRFTIALGNLPFAIYDCIGPFRHWLICGRVALVATENGIEATDEQELVPPVVHLWRTQ